MNEENVKNNTLTDEQVSQIYEGLKDIDAKSTKNLENAQLATEENEYSPAKFNVIESSDDVPGVTLPEVSFDDIEETNEDIKSVISDYGISDEEAEDMVKIIKDFKAGKTSGIYGRLPESFKKMVDGIILSNGTTNMKNIGSYRALIAKSLVNEFINDAKFSAAVNEYNNDMKNLLNDSNKEFNTLLKDSMDNVFNKIDEIRSEDPERAAKIEAIKHSFDSASKFEREMEFAKSISKKKLTKWLSRFNHEAFYFNKRVNSNKFGVKVPDITNLLSVIKYALPMYSEDDIKKFLICIIQTIKDPEDIGEIAYIYRMVDSIYRYTALDIDMEGEELFGNISKVIDTIIS